jgi:hypothetical protein
MMRWQLGKTARQGGGGKERGSSQLQVEEEEFGAFTNLI